MRISDWSSDVCSSDLQDVDELNAVVQALKHALATLPPDIAPVELNQRLANAVSGHHNAQYRISSDSGIRIYATPGSDLDRFAQIAQPVDKITIDTVGIWQDHGETFRGAVLRVRSEEHTSELQSLMRISYAVFCLKQQ